MSLSRLMPRRAAAALAALTLVASAALVPVSADAARCCDDWNEPFVCDLEIGVRPSDSRSYQRLPRSGEIELGYRESVHVQVRGLDQKGRRYPDDRMPLGLEVDDDCDAVVRVEELGQTELRIDARERAGRCRLWVYLPGNQNLKQRIDIDVRGPRQDDRRGTFSPVGRGTAERQRESEFVAQTLYRAILRRDGDVDGLRSAAEQVMQGKTETLIDAMFKSREFRNQTGSRSSEQMLEQFYQGLLGRGVDRGGKYTYLKDLQKGAYKDVLLKIMGSEEYKKRLNR